jgi:hypothetical protein
MGMKEEKEPRKALTKTHKTEDQLEDPEDG